MAARSKIMKEALELQKYLAPVAGKQLQDHEDLTRGIDGRLPKHYIDNFYRVWLRKPAEFIHVEKRPERFEKDEFGLVIPVQNANVRALYPEEFHRGLWGGEGVVKGREQPERIKHEHMNKKLPQHRYWFPDLHHTAVYSEVLDKHIEMTATHRQDFYYNYAGT